MERDEVLNGLRAAFAGVERGAVTLHEAEVIDSYGTVAERARAHKRDTDGSWNAIPDEHIKECASALPHLDPASFRYYLPRFIVFALESGSRRAGTIADAVIYALSYTDQRDLNDHKRERFAVLSLEQQTALAAFLEYATQNANEMDAHVAAEALKGYWRAR